MSFKIGNGQASVDSATTLGVCESVVIMLLYQQRTDKSVKRNLISLVLQFYFKLVIQAQVTSSSIFSCCQDQDSINVPVKCFVKFPAESHLAPSLRPEAPSVGLLRLSLIFQTRYN
jgi:hypothetical protein